MAAATHRAVVDGEDDFQNSPLTGNVRISNLAAGRVKETNPINVVAASRCDKLSEV